MVQSKHIVPFEKCGRILEDADEVYHALLNGYTVVLCDAVEQYMQAVDIYVPYGEAIMHLPGDCMPLNIDGYMPCNLDILRSFADCMFSVYDCAVAYDKAELTDLISYEQLRHEYDNYIKYAKPFL